MSDMLEQVQFIRDPLVASHMIMSFTRNSPSRPSTIAGGTETFQKQGNNSRIRKFSEYFN